MGAKPFREQLPILRGERGWSREALAHRAFAINEEGASVAQITAIERGARHPSAETMATLAKALDVDALTFPEYRLALMRDALDERAVGLDQALANLEALSPGESPGEVVERVGSALEKRLDRELRRSRPSRGRSSTSGRASANE